MGSAVTAVAAKMAAHIVNAKSLMGSPSLFVRQHATQSLNYARTNIDRVAILSVAWQGLVL